MSILLVVLLVYVAVFAYFFSGRDLFSPAIVITYAFILSAIASLYLSETLNYEISFLTVFIIVTFVAIFVFFSSLPRFIGNKGNHRSIYVKNLKKISKSLTVPRIPVFLTVALSIFGIYITFMYMNSIMNIFGTELSLQSALAAYRYQLSFGNQTESLIPTSLLYAYRAVVAIAYCYLYAIIVSLIQIGRAPLLWFIPPAVFIVSTLLQASRGHIVIYLIAAIFIFWVLWQHKYGTSPRIRTKSIFLFTIASSGVLFLFISLNELVGRTTSKSGIDSLMTYLGGSILGFDLFLKDYTSGSVSESNEIWGKETFRGLYNSVGRFFDNSDLIYSFQLEFRFVDGTNIGNLYTAFRYFLSDFGFFGLALAIIMLALLLGSFYSWLIVSPFASAFKVILFSFLAVEIAYMPLAEWHISNNLNPSGLVFIGFLWISSRLLLTNQRQNLSRLNQISVSRFKHVPSN